MLNREVSLIASFDQGFDGVPDVERLSLS